MTVQRWCENPVNGRPWVVLESDYDALLVNRDRLQGALIRVRAHTGYQAWADRELLAELLATIERITDAALAKLEGPK